MGIDLPFCIIILVLLTIGLIMMFSASYPVAYYSLGNSYYYLVRQLIFAAIGVACMFGISFLTIISCTELFLLLWVFHTLL